MSKDSDHSAQAQARLLRLRKYRSRPQPDLSLKFLKDRFRRTIQKPLEQLSRLSGPWQELVPADISAQCSLESLNRGVLTVRVADSATRYALDRLLRSGVERELCRRSGAGLRRIRLQLGNVGKDGLT